MKIDADHWAKGRVKFDEERYLNTRKTQMNSKRFINVSIKII